MNSSIAQSLQRAAAYLQAGQPQLARPLLIDVVKQQPG
jgi:Tfp pilus assembly protein PilF